MELKNSRIELCMNYQNRKNVLSTFYVKYLCAQLCFTHFTKGFCQVIKKFKNPRKTRIGQTSPTHSHIQFFFLKTCTTTKNNTKNTKFPKKHKIQAGAWPTHPLSSFSLIFFIFFNLTKPINILTSIWPYLNFLLCSLERLRSILTFQMEKR